MPDVEQNGLDRDVSAARVADSPHAERTALCGEAPALGYGVSGDVHLAFACPEPAPERETERAFASAFELAFDADFAVSAIEAACLLEPALKLACTLKLVFPRHAHTCACCT